MRQITQRLLQVAQLVHQVKPRQIGNTIRCQARLVLEPHAQRSMSRWGRLVHATAGPAFRFRTAAAQHSFALELLQRWINLAELGGPEIMDALVKESFQIVAARRFAKQAEQDVFQAHVFTI